MRDPVLFPPELIQTREIRYVPESSGSRKSACHLNVLVLRRKLSTAIAIPCG